MSTSALVSCVGTLNPFPGLRPFREDEQKLFFGREAQVDRMVDKLAANRFLAVVGSSGSGKSSLVNCGLRPALRRGLLTSAGSSWRMVQFRPGATPTYALACALVGEGSIIPTFGSGPPRPELIEATLGLSGFGLIDIYKHSALDCETNLLVVVDQFEEMFRYRGLSGAAGQGHGPEAIRFVRLLLDSAAQKEVPIYVVLTMRSDFLGDCAQFDGLAEAISEGQYLVPRMTRDERRAAIEGPIRVVDCGVSTALLTRLVNDVGDNPDQLSILQHAMNRTWAHWRHEGGGKGLITSDDYEAVGTMEKALDRHAEKAFNELLPERQRICERVFKTLTDRGTDPRGIRRPTRLPDLCEIVGASRDEVMEILRPFRKTSRSFLMPAENDLIDDKSVIDVSHESLMRVWERLNDWANEEAEAAREYRRLLDRAEDHGRHKVGLMQDPDLQTTLNFRVRQQPTPAWANLYGGKFEFAMDYLRSSEEHRLQERADRELERRWGLRWQPLILGVAALVFLYVVFHYQPWLMPPTPAAGTGKKAWKDAVSDTVKYGPRLGAVIAALVGLCVGALHLGRALHRKLARPAILNALVRPASVDAVVQARAQDIAAVACTTYASGWRRAGALAIDFVIGLLLLIVAEAVATLTTAAMLSLGVGMGLESILWIGGWLVLLCGYHVLTESSPRQASFGMRAAKIYVTDLNGARLSRQAVVKRELIKIAWFAVVYVIALVPLLIFLALYLFTKRSNPNSPIVRLRQWPHDIASHTLVLVGKPKKASSTTISTVNAPALAASSPSP